MTIHLYAICWNEIRLLRFFFRHYDSLVDRFVMFDDGSTDGTIEYLRGKPKVEVRPFPRATRTRSCSRSGRCKTVAGRIAAALPTG